MITQQKPHAHTILNTHDRTRVLACLLTVATVFVGSLTWYFDWAMVGFNGGLAVSIFTWISIYTRARMDANIAELKRFIRHENEVAAYNDQPGRRHEHAPTGTPQVGSKTDHRDDGGAGRRLHHGGRGDRRPRGGRTVAERSQADTRRGPRRAFNMIRIQSVDL